MPKLHANGLTALHVGDKEIKAKDGLIDVPVEHVADALSHGCSHEPKISAMPATDQALQLTELNEWVESLQKQLTAFAARLDAIEARDASPKKGG